ncbi:hypothetical protein [Thermoanaerobacter thermohydrosulfuricus]|uniref:hypothetical protein n=1 Tax=Thermoanaerobacter thermohydrosulfuricus TaxID=1516 RepID=UPI00039D2DFF|nr:hypothetical protein [Thermoanaerobacter thermohydrosulfuricus]
MDEIDQLTKEEASKVIQDLLDTLAQVEKKKKEPGLKLFVWENVLCSYTEGIAFALAYDVEHARKLIAKKMGWSEGYPEDLEKEPRLITEPEGFYVWGGS